MLTYIHFSQSVHEDLAVIVLKEMTECSNFGYNSHLGKLVTKLVISHEEKAREFVRTAECLLIKISAQPQSVSQIYFYRWR